MTRRSRHANVLPHRLNVMRDAEETDDGVWNIRFNTVLPATVDDIIRG